MSAAPLPTHDSRRRVSLKPLIGGTVFLDEIGEMTPGLQAKLLRFLEEKTFKRVGGLADQRVDVRVIAATNRNLEEEVKTGKIPGGPLLPTAGHADCAAGAAGAQRRLCRCSRTSTWTSFNREFRKRVRGCQRRHRRAGALRLARQRAGAEERD
jgi:hypothetical protein